MLDVWSFGCVCQYCSAASALVLLLNKERCVCQSGQTETRETFSLSSDSLRLRTRVIGCKAPELRPVKTLGIAAATGVIKHRVHRELLSNRADGVVSLLVWGLQSSESAHGCTISTNTSMVCPMRLKEKLQLFTRTPEQPPPPSHFNVLFYSV